MSKQKLFNMFPNLTTDSFHKTVAMCCQGMHWWHIQIIIQYYSLQKNIAIKLACAST